MRYAPLMTNFNNQTARDAIITRIANILRDYRYPTAGLDDYFFGLTKTQTAILADYAQTACMSMGDRQVVTAALGACHRRVSNKRAATKSDRMFAKWADKARTLATAQSRFIDGGM